MNKMFLRVTGTVAMMAVVAMTALPLVSTCSWWIFHEPKKLFK